MKCSDKCRDRFVACTVEANAKCAFTEKRGRNRRSCAAWAVILLSSAHTKSPGRRRRLAQHFPTQFIPRARANSGRDHRQRAPRQRSSRSSCHFFNPLKRMDHSVPIRDEASGLHGIMRTRDGWAGGADPRREGVALGSSGIRPLTAEAGVRILLGAPEVEVVSGG